MNALQSITAVIALIFALCVIVQAIQEFIKDFLNTKPKAMMQALDEFMGNYLNSADCENSAGRPMPSPFNSSSSRESCRMRPLPSTRSKTTSPAPTQGALARFNNLYTKKNK